VRAQSFSTAAAERVMLHFMERCNIDANRTINERWRVNNGLSPRPWEVYLWGCCCFRVKHQPRPSALLSWTQTTYYLLKQLKHLLYSDSCKSLRLTPTLRGAEGTSTQMMLTRPPRRQAAGLGSWMH
jgi:hypothetical protein